jgi:hypothetical protein
MVGHHLDKINQDKNKHKSAEQAPAEHLKKPFRLEDADVMDLQRTIGNQGVQHVMGRAQPAASALPGIVQTKMTVNEPGDQYEHEADRVAHEVMTMPDPVQREGMPEEEELQAKHLQRQDIPEEEELQAKHLQRQDIPEEEELQAKRIQRQEIPEEEELQAKHIQRQEVPEEEELQAQHIQREDVPQVNGDMEARIQTARTGGQGLPESTRSFMESRFGQDFGGVRVHTGAESNELNSSLQARAFTTGGDIFFRDGEYNPESGDGRELLAHELTHVVQQGASSELKTKRDED